MADFKMPSLGADMEAGTLVQWRVAPGEAVHRGQVVAVVETQKGAIDVEVWLDGVVEALEVAEGATVPVGTVLARIGARADTTAPLTQPAAPTPRRTDAPPPDPPVDVTSPDPAAPAPPRGGPPTLGAWIPSSPAARQRARELGLDLVTLAGTGPHGAVRLQDVEAAARRPAAVPAGVAVATPQAAGAAPPRAAADTARNAMRQAIASAMARSNREIPHYYLSHRVDVRAALARVSTLNEPRPPDTRVLPIALFIRAIALALAWHRDLNGFWVDGAFVPGEGIHPGITIALRGGGLVVPCIRDADQKDLEAVMADLRDLTQRARTGRLRSGELSQGTVTITGLGDQGVESVFGVIYPPQVALVGLGRVLDRPWAVDGLLAVRPVLNVTLAGDHRATDGHLGSRFLSRVERLLSAPEEL